jgi:hypothetical protein
MDINTWLQEHPKPEEVKENEDGSQYIPIGIVEQLLDRMTDNNWETKKFKIHFNPEYDLISASLELWVPAYGTIDHYRALTGAITFKAADYAPNEDFAAIAVSECIKNAAKKLGNRFGRSLNGRTENFTPKPKKQSVKLKPDSKIKHEYLQAIANLDETKIAVLEGIYDFQIGS